MHKIIIDPITRVEGHLRIEVMVDNGIVKEAKSSGTLFRGLEIILKGRDPRDATQITQRICGVCPICHATASAMAIETACDIQDKIPDNARIIRNLILGSNFIQSHILHFYHLTLSDYVKVADVPPFTPVYEGDYRFTENENKKFSHHYVEALKIRREAHEMLSILGGKMPHQVGIVAGGVTITPTIDKITNFLWKLNEIREFINNIYLPDVLVVVEKYSDYFEIGKGCTNILTYGVFDLERNEKNLLNRKRLFKSGRTSSNFQYSSIEQEKITEDVMSSWYEDSQTHRHPTYEETLPDMNKSSAYSWIKSPRYDNDVYEVGPLARILITYISGEQNVKEHVDNILTKLSLKKENLFSVMGRHIARAVETKIIADNLADWVLQLKPEEPVFTEFEIPEESEGAGFTEGPRGALAHWIKIKNKKIDNYQCVVPTTWNASPKDDRGVPGPIEQALINTKIKDENNPFEIVRIVRSFDPCLACAVHIIDTKGNVIRKFKTG